MINLCIRYKLIIIKLTGVKNIIEIKGKEKKDEMLFRNEKLSLIKTKEYRRRG